MTREPSTKNERYSRQDTNEAVADRYPQEPRLGVDTSSREHIPIEFREFVASVRESFREIKKFILFLRNQRNANAAMAFLTLLLVLATFTQSILLYRQIGPLRQSADAATHSSDTATITMRLDQRAWLIFDADYSDTLKLTEGEEIAVPIRLRDEGKTLASNITGFVVVEEADVNTVPHFKPGIMTRVKTGIIWPTFPHETTANEVALDGRRVKANFDKRTKFEHGNLAIVVWGAVNYEDVFKGVHWIHFCHTISSNPAMHSPQCADYNQVDTDESIRR